MPDIVPINRETVVKPERFGFGERRREFRNSLETQGYTLPLVYGRQSHAGQDEGKARG
jgi:hypothetical protein